MSPLDATDYDRIQNMIDKWGERIEGQLNLKMPKDESLSRHAANTERIANIEKRQGEVATQITDVVKWAIAEHEKIRAGTDTRFDRLEENMHKGFDEVEKEIKEMKESISEGRAVTLRYMVSVIISFFVGGGLLGFIEFIITRH